MSGAATSPTGGVGGVGGGGELLTVTVIRDGHGYGMKVSGDNPVYVQSVKEQGAAWRAGLRAGDRILRVDGVAVHSHTHQQVVQMIRANPSAVLTVHQGSQRNKTPITAPLPVNPEKQRQLEHTKIKTFQLMLEKEQKYIQGLKSDLLKVPDVRKQAELEAVELQYAKLQREMELAKAAQPAVQELFASNHLATTLTPLAPPTPRPLIGRAKGGAGSPPHGNSTGFLSGLPRSLSNLTGQSLRNLRQARQNLSSKAQQENQPPPGLATSDESDGKRRHQHNNTVPMVPTTCLDNMSPPPLPPRRAPLSPTGGPMNPLAKPIHRQWSPEHRLTPNLSPMHRSMPSPQWRANELLERSLRSSRSFDGSQNSVNKEDAPQPNSIALQMSYPLVNAPPPPLQTDGRTNAGALHSRSHSSPEHLDRPTHVCDDNESAIWDGNTPPPPGTPPPPYAHNTQPCSDPQRAIISMEEDDSPASDTSTYSGLFSNLRCVRESKARTAVLLSWLLGERRCACANLLLLITDGYRSANGVTNATLRRWAYEIQSTFLIPNAVLALTGVDENMANEIEHVLLNEYEKEELLKNVFRKARQKAKDELTQQLTEFQVKRQVGLGMLYGPEDSILEKCDVDKAQESIVVERLLSARLSSVSAGEVRGCGTSSVPPSTESHGVLLAALAAAAHTLHVRPQAIAAAVGGNRSTFLMRDKHYKQRLKILIKQQPQPLVVRGHHLTLQALTSVGHCHHCDHVIWGLAPQAYVCTDCKLRVHRDCARSVEESCCLDGVGDHHNNRISRLMERIHPNNSHQESEKKSRKSSSTSHFLNMERSVRKMEEEQTWEAFTPPQICTSNAAEREARREGSSDDVGVGGAPNDNDHDDRTLRENNNYHEKDTGCKHISGGGGRGVNRAESCREREAASGAGRRGKQRNASDPNRLTAVNKGSDLEPGGPTAPTAPSESSSSSSLSSRSTESNAPNAPATPDQHAGQSEWSEEEEGLATQWTDTVPQSLLETLSPRLRKRQELIHELITSEASHARWLKVLAVVFLTPLERGEQAQLLPPEELRALLPNLPAVRERHARLNADLRALRDKETQIVRIGPVADAVLNTLGDPSYATCLSRFCRGQRMALEALRERRRKSKELHHFLAAREQMPLCGRLQLRDLLACVWQRLTKYQLLLEGVLRTVCDEECDSESAEEVSRLRSALDTAKEVLHSVDTAIRTSENEHRLKTIQNKLEVRCGSGGAVEFEELRRLDLTSHTLLMEGELSIRSETNKKINVLALMLSECLVLLQREGDRFVLKPIPQSSQQGALSPVVKWSTVLFRPNAAVKNTFFLMNINGIQMHELSTNTAAEYTTWTKYISEAPLAEARAGSRFVPPGSSSGNLSRGPSDPSRMFVSVEGTAADDRSGSEEKEKKETPAPIEERERSLSAEREKSSPPIEESDKDKEKERDRQNSAHKEQSNGEVGNGRNKSRRPTVGRVSRVGPELTAPLEALTVNQPVAEKHAHTAAKALTTDERLRRLDDGISRAMKAKSSLVAELLGVPLDNFAQFAELAVAEALGQVDISREWKAAKLDRESSTEDEVGDIAVSETTDSVPVHDMHQLLLAAQAQANQLTETLTRALNVTEAEVMSARSGKPFGLCDSCLNSVNHHRRRSERKPKHTSTATESSPKLTRTDSTNSGDATEEALDRNPTMSFDMLSELGFSRDNEDLPESVNNDTSIITGQGWPAVGLESKDINDMFCGSESALAARLVPLACGLQATLARLIGALPSVEEDRRQLRATLAQQRDANDAIRARHTNCLPSDCEESSNTPTLESTEQRSKEQSGGG